VASSGVQEGEHGDDLGLRTALGAFILEICLVMDAEIPSGFPNIKLSCWELESACAVEQRIGAASAFPSSTWR